MRCAFEVGKQYKAIGVTKTFCFSLQVIFLFNFFLFSNNFLALKKTQLRTWVNSRYHGGGPTQVNQVNQAWHVILFLHLIFVSSSPLPSPLSTTIHTARGDFNCPKPHNCLRKRREEGEGYLFVQKFYNCKSHSWCSVIGMVINIGLPHSYKSAANQSIKF